MKDLSAAVTPILGNPLKQNMLKYACRRICALWNPLVLLQLPFWGIHSCKKRWICVYENPGFMKLLSTAIYSIGRIGGKVGKSQIRIIFQRSERDRNHIQRIGEKIAIISAHSRSQSRSQGCSIIWAKKQGSMLSKHFEMQLLMRVNEYELSVNLWTKENKCFNIHPLLHYY